MSELIVLIVAIVIFALIWYAIGIVPFPPPIASIKWVFFLLLILVAVVWLAGRYLGVSF